ncbi:MAG TPA: SRPBCC domain-containing protein [Acidimicrobiales bacterium]
MSVRQSVRVGVGPDAAFDLFTTGIARWWPLHQGYSYGGDRAAGINLEPRLGGRFYERFVDGDELQVGEVIACDRPRRIVFTWQAPGWAGLTEVEVTFTGDDHGTEVSVEHRGWERLGPEGPEHEAGFNRGWPTVLATYAAAAPRLRG